MSKPMSMLAIAAVSGALSAATFPVSARLVPAPRPGVELKNTGSRAITAWSFAVVSRNARGGEHREVHSADVYLSEVTRGLPRSEEHLDWLRPGESRVVPVDVPPADATVKLVAVVLEDGTTVGDAAAITAFFEHRALERDELGKVVEAFNAVLPNQHGLDALASLKARLAAASTPGGADADESVPHRSAREAVDAYLTKAQAGSADEADRSVRLYADFVGRQYQLAVKHSRRIQN